MGSIPNVGLMAKKAEEYGSHDKTFEIAAEEVVRVVDLQELFYCSTALKLNIWRMCQVKDGPIQDWIKLAVRRSRSSNTPTFFGWTKSVLTTLNWLKIEKYLPALDTSDQVHIKSPARGNSIFFGTYSKGRRYDFCHWECTSGLSYRSVSILELGTSAKMLSIVPLMNGGGLFETGAGGSALDVQQFTTETPSLVSGWISCAGGVAESFGWSFENDRATLLGNIGSSHDQIVDAAQISIWWWNWTIEEVTYLAMYWALQSRQWQRLADEVQYTCTELTTNEKSIVSELNNAQGKAMNIKGYYNPSEDVVSKAMRPSTTFNRLKWLSSTFCSTGSGR